MAETTEIHPTEINNLDEFNAIIGKDNLTVVDFYTTWCPPCKAFAPRFHQLANEFPGANFVKVNIEHAVDVGQKYEIAAIPTIMLFRKGEEPTEVEDLSSLSSEIQTVLAA
ncbi:Thioredoxin-1 [Dactylellina cionopaga]|nr:Thioredoxin-1 [Dactylellina cionopaga]